MTLRLNKRDVGVAVGIALLVVAAATAHAGTRISTAMANTAYCPPNPTVAKKGQVPLYIRLDATNAKGQLMLGGFPLRQYRDGTNRYRIVGMAVSGCWNILLFSRKQMPKNLCVTYYAPFWTPDGQECQTARPYPSGGKEMTFRLYYR